MARCESSRIVLILGFWLLGIQGSALGGPADSHRAILAVTNPTGLARPEEVLEVPLAALQTRLAKIAASQIRVEDRETHRPLPVQLDSSIPGAPADQLLVLVGLAPHETTRLDFYVVQEPAAFPPLVFGRVISERKDDFAWENDKVAYRVYGPALQATGEITSGIDVWSKRVPDLVVNAWYSRDAEGQRIHNPEFSYHIDSGQGLDSYDVGLTRGCGGTGLWADDRLLVSKNYESAEILAEGPIRFRFRLRYAAWTVGETEVSEEKVITLDAGSHLNRIESTFTFIGAKPSAKQAPRWAAGLAMHPNAHLTTGDKGGIVSVWEPLTDASAGMDGTAIVLEPGQTAEVTRVSGNALVLRPLAIGKRSVYYAGAAWSKADIPDEAAWSRYLGEFRKRLEAPLKTQWERIE